MKITDQIQRLDVKEKLNGSLRYIEDIKFENLHYARTLRSTVAKGIIKSIIYPKDEEGIYSDPIYVNLNDSHRADDLAMMISF